MNDSFEDPPLPVVRGFAVGVVAWFLGYAVSLFALYAYLSVPGRDLVRYGEFVVGASVFLASHAVDPFEPVDPELRRFLLHEPAPVLVIAPAALVAVGGGFLVRSTGTTTPLVAAAVGATVAVGYLPAWMLAGTVVEVVVHPTDPGPSFVSLVGAGLAYPAVGGAVGGVVAQVGSVDRSG